MRRTAAGLLLLGVVAAGVRGQDGAPAEGGDPLAVQRRFGMVMRQATAHYEAGEYQAALDRLGTLGPAGERDIGVLNLRGAILTRTGETQAAGEIFMRILGVSPDYFPAAFNLAEVRFLEGDFAGAGQLFHGMHQRDPRNELVRFKLLLCRLLAGDGDSARKIASGLMPAGATPAWYYSQAVMARKEGDRRGEARNLTAAREIYGAESCKLFDESLEVVKF